MNVAEDGESDVNKEIRLVSVNASSLLQTSSRAHEVFGADMPLQKPAHDDRPNVGDRDSSTLSVVKNSDQNSSCNSGAITQISGDRLPVSTASTAITGSSNWSTNYVCVKHVVQEQSANSVRTLSSTVSSQSSGKNVPTRNVVSDKPELQKDNFRSDKSGAVSSSCRQTVPPECFSDSGYGVQSSAVLRNGTQQSVSRKPSRIVSFTTEDFDLFQSMYTVIMNCQTFF